MFAYTLRRLLFAIPTLLVISFIIFALLDLSPGDPTANLPLTIPAEVREQIRISLGLGEPFHVRYLLWLQQFFVNEPLNILERMTGWTIGDSANRMRVISLADPLAGGRPDRRAHAADAVGGRPRPTSSAILIAIPIGVISAYKQYSWFDQFGTLVLDDRLLGADLLHRAGADRDLLGQARLAAVDLRHQPAGDRPRDLLAAGEADDHAGDGARARQRRPDQPLHARLDARQPQPGLRAHRPRQGHEASGRCCWSTCCATA